MKSAPRGKIPFHSVADALIDVILTKRRPLTLGYACHPILASECQCRSCEPSIEKEAEARRIGKTLHETLKSLIDVFQQSR